MAMIARTFRMPKEAAEEIRKAAFEGRISQTKIVLEALYNLWKKKGKKTSPFEIDPPEGGRSYKT